MDIKTFQTASRIYKQLLQIDKEIIALEKLAIEIMNKQGDILIDFNLTTPEQADKNLTSNKTKGLFHYIQFGGLSDYEEMIQKEEKPEPVIKHNQIISESTAVRLIAVLAQEKTEQRTQLIKKLEQYNITT